MLYAFARSIIYIFYKIFYSLEVVGSENMLNSGAVIVAANHVSNLDPPAVGAAIKRKIHFMAKVDLFKNGILGTLLRYVGAFPVRRNIADRGAIRYSLEILKSGNVLGIFPEGRRNQSDELGTPQLGTAMIAARSGAPVVPVAVMGTKTYEKLNGRRKIRVIIGKPIRLSEKKANKEELKQFSVKIMEEISILLEKNSKG